jgi:hypothetical protein
MSPFRILYYFKKGTVAILPDVRKAVLRLQVALHKKLGSDTRDGGLLLNKPPLLVVACNLCAKPLQVSAERITEGTVLG